MGKAFRKCGGCRGITQAVIENDGVAREGELSSSYDLGAWFLNMNTNLSQNTVP